MVKDSHPVTLRSENIDLVHGFHLALRPNISFIFGNGVPADLGDEAQLEAELGGFDACGHKAPLMVGMMGARCGLVEI